MIIEKIHKLRIKYEKEVASTEEKYRVLLNNIDRDIKTAESVNYYSPYQRRYSDLNAAMAQYYQKILNAEKGIHGLAFSAEKYLPSASLLSFGDKNVEEMFETVMLRCRDAVKALGEEHSVEEYAKLLRDFCDVFATVQYMVSKSTQLLIKSGIPDADKKQALSSLEAKKAEIKNDYAEACRFENRECYRELMELKRELEDIYAETSAELVGNVSLGDDEQYRYLLGFQLEKAEEQDLCFCENVLNVERYKIGKTPVYLEPRTGCTNIILNAPYAFLSSEDYYEFVRNLYFSFASRVDKNMLQLGYIDCHEGISVLQRMYNGINSADEKKLLGGDGTFCYSAVNVRRGDRLDEHLRTIADDCNDIISRHSDGVIAHNLETGKNKLPLKLIIVNFYPEGFYDNFRGDKLYEKLQKLMSEYGKSGCMFVVCQDIDALRRSPELRLDAKRCGAVELSISEQDYSAWKKTGMPVGSCELTIDGKPASIDIAVSDLNEREYWERLRDYYSKKKIFSLRDVYKKTDAKTNGWRNPPSVFDEAAIEIPLGLKGAEEYNLRFPLPAAGHTLIYGGSGSGKSSFLHTLILSMCYKYSSEEIEIYLADFKETEFNFYQTHQLPHIKYYLCKNGISEVCDVFDMIERIRKDRGELLKKYGCADILQYNQKAKNKGNMPKMPVLFFIVDEYKIIETVVGPHSPVMRRINSSISNTLTQARAMGINLILCTQNIETIDEISVGNVKNYILMGKQDNTDRYIRQYFLDNNRDLNLKEVTDFLAVADSGHCLIRSASSVIGEKVRFAYAGKDTKKEYVKDILRIHDREEISLVLGGSEDAVDISGYSAYRNELERFDDDKFNLTVGIGSTSGFPISIDFDTGEEGCGWLAYSKGENRFAIIRNAILSFLYKTAVLGYDYYRQPIGTRVLYFGDNRSYSMTLGKRYFGSADRSLIESHVKMLNVNDDVYDICSLIVELKDQLEPRIKGMDRDDVIFYETRDYPPYLLVIQSLEWLERSNIEAALAEHQGYEETKKPTSEDIVSDSKNVDTDSWDEIMGYAYGSFFDDDHEEKTPVATAPKTTSIINYNTVKDALNKLFMEGNQCGIFVLINPARKESVGSVLGTRSDIWKNCTYGSFEEFGNVSDDQSSSGASKNVCYVGESGIKTRLYDYSPDTQFEWWQEFRTIMEED